MKSESHITINVKSFSITAMIVATVPGIILFVWSSINGFGIELVRLFESIHPSGGLSIVNNFTDGFLKCLPGILINTFYSAVDSFIAGFAFSSLYNYLASRLGN